MLHGHGHCWFRFSSPLDQTQGPGHHQQKGFSQQVSFSWLLACPGQRSLKTEGLPELKSGDPTQESRAKSCRLLVSVPDTGTHPEDGLQPDGCLQIHFLPCQRKGRRALISLLPRVFLMTTQEANVRLLLTSTNHPGDTDTVNFPRPRALPSWSPQLSDTFSPLLVLLIQPLCLS